MMNSILGLISLMGLISLAASVPVQKATTFFKTDEVATLRKSLELDKETEQAITAMKFANNLETIDTGMAENGARGFGTAFGSPASSLSRNNFDTEARMKQFQQLKLTENVKLDKDTEKLSEPERQKRWWNYLRRI
jgi:hypothetical protein